MEFTKEYYEDLLYKYLLPFITLYDNSESSIIIPNEIATSYEVNTMRLESFSRSLLGWSFLKGYEDVKRIILSMIKNGVNCNCNKYWGKLHNNDQKIVEMFPILLFCIENKILFEENFNSQDKQNLQNWFFQINEVQVPHNNWQFFIILVNRFLKLLDLEYSKERSDQAFSIIEDMYLGDGWYSDGKTQQRDYYIPFAFHYYALLYSKYTPEDNRSDKFLHRSKLFAQSFKLFFSKEGNALAFGRSLTYKFAQVAFWAIYSDFLDDEYELSYIKGIINRNLTWWQSQNIIDSNGFLNIGYSYHNQFMTEYYNAKGSSYWCLKLFIILINKSDRFFKITPLEFHSKERKELIPALFSTLITHNGHSYLFMNGQKSNNQFGNTEAKYEKFLYSTICAPCVSRSLYGIENLACDNSLVVQIGNTLLVRKSCKIIKIDRDIMISKWIISKDISISSYIFPDAPYHYRIHVVKTNQKLYLYDFGSAIKRDSQLSATTTNNIAICHNQNQASAIYTLKDQGFANICNCSPNVNIQFPNVVIPYTCIQYARGIHYVIDCCYNNTTPINTNKSSPKKIEIRNKYIFYNGKQYKLEVPLSENSSLYSKLIGFTRRIKLIINYFK